MNDFTLSQEYLICAVNEKGKFSGLGIEKQVCLVAAGLLELQLDHCIALDQKRVTVTGALPAGKHHLEPLYNVVNQPKPLKTEKMLEDYTFSLTDKKLTELFESIGGSLETMGLATSAKSGLLGNKKSYTPTKEAIHRVVDMVRAELLEDGEVTEDIAALAILLEQSKCLKSYFSDFERKEIKSKLKEAVSSPNGKLIKDMVDYVETMIAVMTTVMIATTNG